MEALPASQRLGAAESGSKHPVVGVGGVLIHKGKVLLIQRGKEPLKGSWAIPGGAVELGETLEDAVIRELREETGITVRPETLLNVFDHIERPNGQVRSHYVIADYLCRYVSGSLQAGSDALAATFAGQADLATFDLPDALLTLIADAFHRV